MALYTPGFLPEDLPGLKDIREELRKISRAFSQISSGDVLEKRSTPPERPQEGALYLADGVNWNPGGGKGVYRYDEDTGDYHKLG